LRLSESIETESALVEQAVKSTVAIEIELT